MSKRFDEQRSKFDSAFQRNLTKLYTELHNTHGSINASCRNLNEKIDVVLRDDQATPNKKIGAALRDDYVKLADKLDSLSMWRMKLTSFRVEDEGNAIPCAEIVEQMRAFPLLAAVNV